MFKLQTLVTWVLLLGVLAIGCSGDDGDDPTNGPSGGAPPAEMVGSWTFQSVTIDGAAAVLADVMEWIPGAVAAKIHIQANSAYVYEEVDTNGGQLWFESGFVFIDGNELDINTQMDGDGTVNETSRHAFTLSAGVFTLQETDQGMTIVFTLGM